MTITNLGNIEITDQQVRSALSRAALAAGANVRADGGMIERYRQQNAAEAIGEIRQQRRGWEPAPELRADAERAWTETGRNDAALTPGSAGFLRDFDYIHREILEERRPQMNAGAMFAVDSSVPLGAPTHTMRRAVTTGKAKWHNKGGAFPVAKAGYLEEQFRTGFVVCAVEQSFFEGLQLGFAGLQNYRLEANAAIRAIEEFLNDVAFYGDTARQIYGALTYPSLAKMVIPTQFAIGGSVTGRAIVAALHDLVNKPMIVSGGVFKPNRLAVPEAVHAFLATTPLDTSGGTVTLKQFFLEGQSKTSGIRDIEIARELSAAELTAKGVGNPAGYHGVLAWNDTSMRHVLPQRPTFLPIYQSSPIDTLHVAFASTGGVVAPDVGDHILGFVQL